MQILNDSSLNVILLYWLSFNSWGLPKFLRTRGLLSTNPSGNNRMKGCNCLINSIDSNETERLSIYHDHIQYY